MIVFVSDYHVVCPVQLLSLIVFAKVLSMYAHEMSILCMYTHNMCILLYDTMLYLKKCCRGHVRGHVRRSCVGVCESCEGHVRVM